MKTERLVSQPSSEVTLKHGPKIGDENIITIADEAEAWLANFSIADEAEAWLATQTLVSLSN